MIVSFEYLVYLPYMDFCNSKKILILGPSGRGKTTLAKNLAEETNLPLYSVDDFLWKKKFSELNTKEDSFAMIEKVYKQDEWIVEGGSYRMTSPSVPLVDLIILLEFKSVFHQWKSIIMRSRRREHETLGNLISLLIYVTKKRFGIGSDAIKNQSRLLARFPEKVVRLSSFGEIDDFLKVR
jgi:GTPase SAR1 family protein